MVKLPIEIKQISHTEVQLLQNISKRTFRDAFEADNESENIEQYLHEQFSLSKLTQELLNESSYFYFAVHEQKPIGYLKINRPNSQTELKDENACEIERLYVLEAFQGLHVGSNLIEHAKQVAKTFHAEYLWLGVWEKNTKAIQFYTKLGFVIFNRHIFKLGKAEQVDWMMKMNL
jgi:ribosomal protein S18 acetylase RimI-like enzyme